MSEKKDLSSSIDELVPQVATNESTTPVETSTENLDKELDEDHDELLEMEEPENINKSEIDGQEILEIDDTSDASLVDAKSVLHRQEFIDIDDEDDDILEYGSPDPEPSKPITHIDESLNSSNFLSIPIILQTGNFPYLLAPLTPEKLNNLPQEYEDAIILFDDGIILGITLYEVFTRIRKTFRELENPFDDDDDLILNFKEFDISLPESSVYAHQLILSEVIAAFNTFVENSLDDPPQCLHLELSAEKNFITKFDAIRGRIKPTNKSSQPIIVGTINLDSDSDLDSDLEEVDRSGEIDIEADYNNGFEMNETDKSETFKLSEEEKKELDDSLTPEELEEGENTDNLDEEKKTDEKINEIFHVTQNDEEDLIEVSDIEETHIEQNSENSDAINGNFETTETEKENVEEPHLTEESNLVTEAAVEEPLSVESESSKRSLEEIEDLETENDTKRQK